MEIKKNVKTFPLQMEADGPGSGTVAVQLSTPKRGRGIKPTKRLHPEKVRPFEGRPVTDKITDEYIQNFRRNAAQFAYLKSLEYVVDDPERHGKKKANPDVSVDQVKKATEMLRDNRAIMFDKEAHEKEMSGSRRGKGGVQVNVLIQK
jgi:hypothetical protein